MQPEQSYDAALPDFDVVVTDVVVEAEDVISLVLARPDGMSLAPWDPGAHIDLRLGPAIERQYSLCGDPHNNERWRIAVLRERAGRGGSEWIHNNARPGMPLTVRGPRNNFPLVKADRYVFVAGGIGITPLLPMIIALDAQGANWELVYGGRHAQAMAFAAMLEAYGQQVTLRPQDMHGLLDLERHIGEPHAGTAVYCCGPGPLIVAVEEWCNTWPPGALHVERFHPREAAAGASDRAFVVVLGRSGIRVGVAAGQSIVDALETIGVEIPTSCREGTCGTCETGVLEGIPDHRDSVLMEEEKQANDVIMPCCSRALTPVIVLDL
jgi:ferredoxin-NADP reductase